LPGLAEVYALFFMTITIYFIAKRQKRTIRTSFTTVTSLRTFFSTIFSTGTTSCSCKARLTEPQRKGGFHEAKKNFNPAKGDDSADMAHLDLNGNLNLFDDGLLHYFFHLLRRDRSKNTHKRTCSKPREGS
jgi:hypothetical protein